MKKLFAMCLFTLMFFSGNAQGTTALTKEETINYIQGKLSEVGNRWLVNREYTKLFLVSASIGFKDEKIGITEFRRNKDVSDENPFTCGDWVIMIFNGFDPIEISEITDSPYDDSESVGFIKINLASEKALCSELIYVVETKSTDTSPCSFPKLTKEDYKRCDSLYVPYLKSDPENFDKIKKALEHLKKLSMESKNLFSS